MARGRGGGRAAAVAGNSAVPDRVDQRGRGAPPPREVGIPERTPASSSTGQGHEHSAQLKTLVGVQEHVNGEDATNGSSETKVGVQEHVNGEDATNGSSETKVRVQEHVNGEDATNGSSETKVEDEPKLSLQDEGPMIVLVSKRIRKKNKLLRDIAVLEQEVKSQKEISKSQKDKIGRKGKLIVEVGELESLRELMRQAIAEELSSKVQFLKISEAGGQDAAQVEFDQFTVKRFYKFLKRHRLKGDGRPFYHGDAMSLLSRSYLRIPYSDIYNHDKSLAMKICADYERLKPSITRAAKRFAKKALKSTVKGATLQMVKALNDNVENLNVIIVAMPKSHQMLNNFIEPRSILLEDVDTHSDQENLMKTPSDTGATFLTGTLQDLISKHLQGLSCNGHLNIGTVEVYNGNRYVINSRLFKYKPGSKEWAVACKKDFTSHAYHLIPLFKTGTTYPPYMAELRTLLLTVSIETLMNRIACLVFHEFVVDHMAGKPIPVRAALVGGIHNCCHSVDSDDPANPYKKIIEGLAKINPELGYWKDAVMNSGNLLMIQLLLKRLKNGQVLDCKFTNDLLSMDTYLRVLHEHGSNYTKDKKMKNTNLYLNQMQNQSSNQNPNLNAALTSQSVNQTHSDNRNQIQMQGQNLNAASASVHVNDYQVQRLKSLNELEMIGARHLGPYVLELIYSLLKAKAMTGMMLPVWKAFKSCKAVAS